MGLRRETEQGKNAKNSSEKMTVVRHFCRKSQNGADFVFFFLTKQAWHNILTFVVFWFSAAFWRDSGKIPGNISSIWKVFLCVKAEF